MLMFFIFALSMTILLLNYNKYGLTQFENTTFVMVSEQIASESFKKGDLVLVKSKKISELETELKNTGLSKAYKIR